MSKDERETLKSDELEKLEHEINKELADDEGKNDQASEEEEDEVLKLSPVDLDSELMDLLNATDVETYSDDVEDKKNTSLDEAEKELNELLESPDRDPEHDTNIITTEDKKEMGATEHISSNTTAATRLKEQLSKAQMLKINPLVSGSGETLTLQELEVSKTKSIEEYKEIVSTTDNKLSASELRKKYAGEIMRGLKKNLISDSDFLPSLCFAPFALQDGTP